MEENKVIKFPGGLPGFEDLTEYTIKPVEGTNDLLWLQSEENPDVAMLVIYPFSYFKEYDIEIPEEEINELEIQSSSEVLVLSVVTIPRDDPAGATANLVAPVVINTRLKKGKQVILTGTNYTTRHNLFPPNIKERVSSGEGA